MTSPVGSSVPGKVSGPEARQLVEGGALLLDVRTPEEFAARHVPGALNIPVQVLSQRLAEVGSKEREVVVYCQAGGRSARAAAELRQAGFKVHDLGGIGNWGP
ncbi:MAG TPA: rhodanese-like domain-containing protein [Polyangia bacterium]